MKRPLQFLVISIIALLAAQSVAAAPGSPALDAAIAATKPHDLSVWTMFVNADIVVKFVMVGLLLASVATWTILIAKTIELKRSRERVMTAIRRLSEARGLSEARLALGGGDRLTQALLGEATREMKLSSDILAAPGVKERIAASFAEIERAEALSIKRGTGLLASVGSTGPFIGLFGTVWGIMNSFQSIAISKNTSLAVVAPGIAEALFATALGLLAAIPAVVAFNKLTKDMDRYAGRLDSFAGEFSAILSREMEEKD